MIKILLAIHLFSFAVAAGGGVANMLAARSARGAAAEAARAIGGVQAKIGRLSFIALLMLWLTGVWMVLQLGGFAAMPALFSTKMVFVLIVTLAALYAQFLGQRAAKSGTPPNGATMARLGMVSGISALCAMVLAVWAFN